MHPPRGDSADLDHSEHHSSGSTSGRPSGPGAPTVSSDAECCICQAEFASQGPDADETAHTLDCGHRFHTRCIVRWFRSSTTAVGCPICRDVPAFSGGDDESEDETASTTLTESAELCLHEREMNMLLREHLCFARRKICPHAVKAKVRKYRQARDNMVKKRRDLFIHERRAVGRYVDLKRRTVRLHRIFVTAQSRFVRDALTLYRTPLR